MDTLRYHASRVGQFWRERLGKATLAMAVVLLVSAVLGYALCASNPKVTNALMEYFMSVMLESGVVSETRDHKKTAAAAQAIRRLLEGSM